MIRPTVVHADGSLDFLFDELGHSGTITAAAVQFAASTTGGPSPYTLVLTCPDGCGSVSYHPVSGDASCRALIQTVFMAKVVASGCPCGALAAGKPTALVRAHLRQHAQQLGGPWLA